MLLPTDVFSRNTVRRIAVHFFTAVVLLVSAVFVIHAQTTTRSSTTDGATPRGLASGAGTYALSGFDNINPYSGSLSFRLPLLSVGGRGSVGYTMMLPIERKWRVEHITFDPNLYCASCETYEVTHTYMPSDSWWTGLKPRYSPGVLQGRSVGDEVITYGTCRGYKNRLTRLTFTSADGAEYELRDELYGGKPLPGSCSTLTARGTIFKTADGTSATFLSDVAISDFAIPGNDNNIISPSGYLVLRDGTRYRIDSGEVTNIRDRNGNELRFSGDSIIDSLNRYTTYTRVNGTTTYDQIAYTGVGATSRTLRVMYGKLADALRPANAQHPAEILKTHKQLFQRLDGSDEPYNPQVVTEVQLPDGRQYRFFYNSYGELARVELPTGGAYEYDYQATDGVISLGFPTNDTFRLVEEFEIYRRVEERRVYNAGGELENRMLVSGCGRDSGGGACHTDVTQYDANGNWLAQTRHHYYGEPEPGIAAFARKPTHYSAWGEGKEYKTEVLGSDGFTVLQRVENTWQQRAPVSWWNSGNNYELGPEPSNDVRLVETKTTLGDTNLITRQTFGYDEYNNRTGVEEYAYGTGAPGALMRRTTTSYLHQTNPTYATDTNIHLRSLPTQTSVFDVGNTEQTRTTIEYDSYAADSNRAPLMSRNGISGMDAAFANTNYTTRGNPTCVTSWLKDANGNFTIAYNSYPRYDVAGNVVSVKDARGNVSSIDYTDSFSDNSNRHTYAFPTSTTSVVPDPTNTYGTNTPLTSSTKYDYATGLPTATVDANGVVSEVKYADPDTGQLDPLNRVRQVIRAVGVAGVQSQTKTTYDDVNRTVTVESDLNTYNDKTLKSQTVYDGLGRTVETRTYESPSAYIATRTEYDALGRTKRTSNPFRPASESPQWMTPTYDALGRVLTVTTPDGATVSTSYSGTTVTVTDQAGKARRSETDALGRLANVTEAANVGSCQPDGAGCTTDYTYDVLGNLRKVTQGSQQRYFSYDSLSRLIRAKNPEQAVNANLNFTDPVTGYNGWSLAYTYDANSNPATRVDARNITTTYAYDALNRNTTTTYTNDPTNTATVRRKYDAAVLGRGRLYRTFNDGAEAAVPYVMTYDALGRVKEKRNYYLAGASWRYVPITYNYDLAGNATSLSLLSNYVTQYTYDQAGRTQSVTGMPGDGVQRTYATNIGYSAFGGVAQEQFGTQTPLYHKRQYNVRGQVYDIRLSTQSAQQSADNWNRGALVTHYSNAGGVWGADGANNNGNALRTHHFVPNDDAISTYAFTYDDYDYDALNRLASMTERIGMSGATAFTQAYTYDRFGNRTINQAGTTQNIGINKEFRVDAANNNRLLPPTNVPTTTKMEYDGAGNLTNDTYTGAGTRKYDAEGRMIEATDNAGGVVRYVYDGDGRRARRFVGGGVEWRQVYGAAGELLREYSPGGAVSHLYMYRGGEVVAKAECEVVGGVTQVRALRYMVADHLGTPRMIVDQSGSLAGVSRHDYLPFGEELTANVGGRTTGQGYSGTDNVRQKFTGKERDTETGMDYFGARYYSSTQGRFIGVDKANPELTNPQTLNMYQYCVNNPLRYVDRNGMYEEDVHRYLTQVLAWAAGYKGEVAEQIAKANQATDDNWSTSPFGNPLARRDYHFTSQERRDEMWNNYEYGSVTEGGSIGALGRFLHAQQDSFSHAGYGWMTGHWRPGRLDNHQDDHRMDKTYNDPDKADRMAEDTFSYLLKAAARASIMTHSAPYKSVPWSIIKPHVQAFNRARTYKEKEGHIQGIIKAVWDYRLEQAKGRSIREECQLSGNGKCS